MYDVLHIAQKHKVNNDLYMDHEKLCHWKLHENVVHNHILKIFLDFHNVILVVSIIKKIYY